MRKYRGTTRTSDIRTNTCDLTIAQVAPQPKLRVMSMDIPDLSLEDPPMPPPAPVPSPKGKATKSKRRRRRRRRKRRSSLQFNKFGLHVYKLGRRISVTAEGEVVAGANQAADQACATGGMSNYLFCFPASDFPVHSMAVQVRLARHKATHERVAIKILRNVMRTSNGGGRSLASHIHNEIDCLSKLCAKTRHVVALREVAYRNLRSTVARWDAVIDTTCKCPSAPHMSLFRCSWANQDLNRRMIYILRWSTAGSCWCACTCAFMPGMCVRSTSLSALLQWRRAVRAH